MYTTYIPLKVLANWMIIRYQPTTYEGFTRNNQADIESDHLFRLGLREPLAPIKPLAARSGAIVKAAMQPPPDNKELCWMAAG